MGISQPDIEKMTDNTELEEQSDSASNVPCGDVVMRKVLEWIAGPNTGLSSESMAYCTIAVSYTHLTLPTKA